MPPEYPGHSFTLLQNRVPDRSKKGLLDSDRIEKSLEQTSWFCYILNCEGRNSVIMQKRSPVIISHLILMFLMMFGTIGGAVHFIIEAVGSETSTALFSNITNIVLMAVILSMLIMGAVYIIKDYSKQAAVFYKAFMFLHVGVCVLSIIVNLCFYTVNPLIIVICILYGFKAIDLLILVFWKDLGKKKTWILFYVILGLDLLALILSVINMVNIGFDFSFTGYVTALIADGTIGLSVKGKYENKEARGSK